MSSGRAAAGEPLLDAPGDERRLVVLAGDDDELDLRPAHRGGPQLLGTPLGQLRDHAVRGLEHRGDAPVVLLQPDLGRAGKRLLEAEDVPHLGAAPAVDALVVVAHRADVSTLGCELTDELELRTIAVLELVDQQVAEPPDVAAQHLWVLAEQPQREQEEVVEVHRSLRLQRALVDREHLGRGELGVARGVALRRGRPTGVLGPADSGQDPAGVEVALPVDGPLAERPLDQGDLIRDVGDGELPRPAEPVHVLAEHLGAEGVEGADGERLCALPHQAHHPLLHLGGGLVGEGHREDGAGRDALVEEPGDAVRDDPRLPASCPGEHQQGTFGGGDGATLRRVQAGEVHAGANAYSVGDRRRC